jgi:hypothetical protein
MLWRSLESGAYPSAVGRLAQYFFLTFAFNLWPFWIPLSLYSVEEDERRKKILSIALCAGILLSVIYFINFLIYPVSAKIVNQSIQYGDGASSKYSLLQKLVYAGVVLIPCFISSVRYIWIFGILGAIAWIIAQGFYEVNFISVWCFFAAVISIVIFWIMLNLTDSNIPSKPQRR